MTNDDFLETYEALLDAAYDGYAVCVIPLEDPSANDKLGVVLLPSAPAAEEAAEHLEDDELLELSTMLILKAKRIAEKMAASGIDSYEGPDFA